jgi:formylglycine-generating enzyme required for sulfatase activity
MVKNCAICLRHASAIAIGINGYDFLQPLRFAQRDAELMQKFLQGEAGFEQIYFFADNSPDINGKSTRPNRANLLRVLRQLFKEPFLGAGDNFWFFFSGHGIRHADRDYLMPCDGDPEDIENTAIEINFVTERLRRCGADNVVLVLDACRSLGTRAGEGIGRQTANEARSLGVISIFSCSPQEYSYEIEALQQGAFTCALLEGLGIQGKCATVERLNQYISFRVPELVQEHHRGKQTPYIIAEPVNKSHLILVPQYASLADIATLKNDAYGAEVEKNLGLAEQLWIRVLVAASGQDIQAVRALQRIALLQQNLPNPDTQYINKEGKGEEKGSSLLQTFRFETVTVNAKGTITNRRNLEAKYFVEDLGNGVTLEMVQIPGGTFTMGSPATEAKRYDAESPQHQVTVPTFFMGRYQVTQAQYQAIVGKNPSNFQGAKRPVEKVSWDDAVEFCKQLSKNSGRNYRLPSEAEWEYACRALTTTPFYFGETITTDLVNYGGTVTPYGSAPKGIYREETTEVGKFPPNAFGLYDMHGNVWEWCQDYWHDNYQGAPTDGSAWLTGGDNTRRLLRGGSWYGIPESCRSAYRFRDVADNRVSNIGFRLGVVLA